ncbi:MAG: tRNA dihydrouridine(20/20a) synthase DusA [Gammaproteobacteria bacterium]|nr:tRNA dihydrouridine(20/20a) synthase DusA [Gammaproteobacteria bacterium]|tara:strand:+ start:3000 stop:3965 length:966 start_codon:yes stop_codon:yes gene_type:complete
MNNNFSIAPMMNCTDRHCRYFMRLLSPSALLYTEMVTAAAIQHSDSQHFLSYNNEEHPLALQLGGSNPKWMANAASKAHKLEFDEININVGCPSDRVQSGHFGACLMASPNTVSECYKAMSNVTDIPITIKTRIGLDDNDSYEFLFKFVESLAFAGCKKFIIHARIAVLNGLSPKENRTVPPLNYNRVFRLKQEFPDLEIILNGGISNITDVELALSKLDGVMIGRQAYYQPYFLAELEKYFNLNYCLPARRDIVNKMTTYIDKELNEGVSLNNITRHMLGLYAGQNGAKIWRRTISEKSHHESAGSEILTEALNAISIAA